MHFSLLVVLLAPVAAFCAACAPTAVQEPAPGGRAATTMNWTAQTDDGSYEERARRVLGGDPAAGNLPVRELDEDLLYKFLLAEIAGQRGDVQLAARTYLDLARSTRDPRIARRATEIALYAKMNDAALEAAKIWLATERDSAAARQTLVTLLVNARNLDAARPLLAELLASDKDNVGPALLQLPGLFARYPDKSAAYQLVVDLTKPYLGRPEAHFALSQSAYLADHRDIALAEIREALRIKPDWEQGALLQAQLLGREGHDSSLAYLKQFLDAHPGAQDVRLNYARALIADKRYPEARAEFQKLLDANGDNPDLAFTVALLSVQMNDLDVAERQLKHVLDLHYRDPDAVRFHLGQVDEERKRPEEAARWYRSVEGGEQFVVAQARYAMILARAGRVDEARKYLQDLQTRNEAQRVPLIQAEAQMLREVKRYQESYEVLRQALESQPDQPDLLYDIALAAEKLDRLDVTESSLRKLVALKPDNAQAWNALGYTLADRTDRLSEARDYIEKALKLAPDDPFILDSMGWVEYRLGKLEEGVGYLRRAFEQRQDPEIAAHLGEVLWAKGTRDEAERIWRDSLREHPDSEELQKTIRRFIKK